MLIRDERSYFTDPTGCRASISPTCPIQVETPDHLTRPSTHSATTSAIGTKICSSATLRTNRVVLRCVRFSFKSQLPEPPARHADSAHYVALQIASSVPIPGEMELNQQGGRTVLVMTFKKQPKQEIRRNRRAPAIGVQTSLEVHVLLAGGSGRSISRIAMLKAYQTSPSSSSLRSRR